MHSLRSDLNIPIHLPSWPVIRHHNSQNNPETTSIRRSNKSKLPIHHLGAFSPNRPVTGPLEMKGAWTSSPS